MHITHVNGRRFQRWRMSNLAVDRILSECNIEQTLVCRKDSPLRKHLRYFSYTAAKQPGHSRRHHSIYENPGERKTYAENGKASVSEYAPDIIRKRYLLLWGNTSGKLSE